MLLVNKNANNNLIVTLYETNLISYPYYLFEFTSDITDVAKCFIAQDISTHIERYNEFLITETSGTEILTSGTITLNPSGQWTYRIYGQYSSTNLNVASATSLLETGIVKVVGSPTTYIANSDLDNTFIVNE